MARITPLDLRKQEFKQSALGLNKDQVHDFLEMVAEELEVLIRERSELQDDLKDVQSELDKYKEIEHSMHSALVMAKESAAQSVKAAEREADAILSQARTEKNALLFAAKDQLNEIQNDIRDLKLKRDGFVMNFRTILKTHMDALTVEFSNDAVMAAPVKATTESETPAKTRHVPIIGPDEERIIDFSKSDLTLSDLDEGEPVVDSAKGASADDPEDQDHSVFDEALDFELEKSDDDYTEDENEDDEGHEKK